ncbi:MAG: DUF805 domain-containing protein [Faecalibacterium sp.]
MDNYQKYIDIYLNFWKNFSNVKDRTDRLGYWLPILVNCLAAYLIGLLGVGILSQLVSLAIFIPGITISVRRMHDVGHTWKYLLINFIPLVGWILFIIALAKPSIDADGKPTV